VLRKICGCKRDEITGVWERLRVRNEQLNNLFERPNQENEMSGSCDTYGKYERYIQGFDFGMLSFDVFTSLCMGVNHVISQ
jgi:hypothetical protein